MQGQKDKMNFKPQDYYQQNAGHRKEWERGNGEREKTGDKMGDRKIPQKKETQSYETKRKQESPQKELQLRQNLPQPIPASAIAYYPNMPPITNPYAPPGFYPPYGPPQPGMRHPYAMYPPQMHHQLPPNMYVPQQGPYPVVNPHIYQIPPPHIPYGSVPIVQPIP